MGTLLYRKRNVVVSSKQQDWNKVPTLPMRRIAFKMKAYSWAPSEFRWCPRVPMRKTGFGLQLDSGDEVLGWEGTVSV